MVPVVERLQDPRLSPQGNEQEKLALRTWPHAHLGLLRQWGAQVLSGQCGSIHPSGRLCNTPARLVPTSLLSHPGCGGGTALSPSPWGGATWAVARVTSSLVEGFHSL
jgi:hypothetical protein